VRALCVCVSVSVLSLCACIWKEGCRCLKNKGCCRSISDKVFSNRFPPHLSHTWWTTPGLRRGVAGGRGEGAFSSFFFSFLFFFWRQICFGKTCPVGYSRLFQNILEELNIVGGKKFSVLGGNAPPCPPAGDGAASTPRMETQSMITHLHLISARVPRQQESPL